VHTGFWWRDVRESNRLEILGVEGRIILKWIFKKLDGEARDGHRWQAFVNVVMNVQVP